MIFCMIFDYFYAIYKRIILEQHKWDTFTALTILSYIYLPRDIHHPDVGSQLNLLRISEFRKCSYDIKAFSLDIHTRSNTLKLFPFLHVLTRSFSSPSLNNHVIIDYKTMIVSYTYHYILVILLVRICLLQNNSYAPTRQFFTPSTPGM